MAQGLLRKTLKVFGLGGTTDDFEEFGSTAVSSTNYTKDIPTIQALAAWDSGWRAALITGKAPVLQDMNAWMYVHSYMAGYMFQEGIPEWDSGTTYDAGAVVKIPYGGTFALFVSLGDANIGNALPTAPASNAHWQFLLKINAGAGLILPGTNTSDDAPATAVGEYQRSNAVATNIMTGSPLFQDIASLNLTKGDWDVSGLIVGAPTNTGTELEAALSKNSGNTQTDHVLGDNWATQSISVAGPGRLSIAIPSWRVSLAADHIVYLKASAAFLTGTYAVSGRISARRVR